MREIVRLAVVFALFTSAVCGFAAIAHHAEEESELIVKCRARLAESGLGKVNVACRGTEVILRGKVLTVNEKTLALKAIGTLDRVGNISHGGLTVANH